MRNIISDETNDINAPVDSGTRGWGGRGWALSLLAVAMDRSELPRAMPTGAIERFIVHAQTRNKQIYNNQLVLLFILYLIYLHLFFLHGPISTSCFKSKFFPDFREVTLNPLSKWSAARSQSACVLYQMISCHSDCHCVLQQSPAIYRSACKSWLAG